MLRPASLFLLSVLISSCVFAPEVTGPADRPAPEPFTSISNLMFNFQLAHEERDIELYRDCLDRGYQFYFDEDDVDAIGADFLNREEDVAAMDQIFNSPELVSLRFSYSTPERIDTCWEDGSCASSLNTDWAEVTFWIEFELTWIDRVERACGPAIFDFYDDDSSVQIIRIQDRTGETQC